MFDAVVLAGGGKPDPLTESEGVSNKAFIDLHGRPLLEYVLAGLKQAPSVDKIVVVGPEDDLLKLRGAGEEFHLVAETGAMLDNLAAGFAALDRERLCLIVTGDIPLLSAAVVEKFLCLCEPHDHEFYYPVLSREVCLQSFPETERTYVRLHEGAVTGGNIGLIRPGWFLDHRDRLEMFISYRKKPLKLMRIMPFNLIIKFLFHRLTIADLEKHLSRLLHLKARAVVCDSVEIAVDVDKPQDLALVRKVLS